MIPSSRLGFISAMSLFLQPAPCLDYPRPELFPMLCAEFRGSEQKHPHLSALVDELSAVGSLQGHQASYLGELRRSMASAAVLRRLMMVLQGNQTIQLALDQNLQDVRKGYSVIRQHVSLALTSASIAHTICTNAGVCPQISPRSCYSACRSPFVTRMPGGPGDVCQTEVLLCLCPRELVLFLGARLALVM